MHKPAPTLRMVTWNLAAGRGFADGQQLDELSRLTAGHDAVAALQEVGPSAFDELCASGIFSKLATSLSHRPPGPLERQARHLGVVVGITGSVGWRGSSILARAPYPDRTLRAELAWHGRTFAAWSVHSVTGVGYRHAKVDAFLSLAEALATREMPTLLGIDANCPKVDAPLLKDSEWWWPKGEPECFGVEAKHDAADAYRTWLATEPASARQPQKSPLAVTYVRGAGASTAPCRYDRVHASPEWRVLAVEHLFSECGHDGRLGWRGSDHGPVIVDVGWGRSTVGTSPKP